nr:hypothetical protein [uncultured Caldimonas sp.]
MKSLTEAWRATWLTGGVASVTSTLALLWRGRVDGRCTFGALNAPSHWVWGDQALRQNGCSLRYTGTGLLIHHVASVFWAMLYERACPALHPRSAAQLALESAAVATVAAGVDLRIAPRRLTPGFERRLSRRSLVIVYASFAAGIALGGWLADRMSITAPHPGKRC